MTQKSNLNHIKDCVKKVEEWCKERNIDYTNMTEEDKFTLSFYMRSLKQ